MRITKSGEAVNRVRDDGTKITYYMFPEYEVHYGEIMPGVIQPWHHHDQIVETLYVISGKILLHYLEDGLKVERELVAGDVVQVEDTPHTFSNPFSEVNRMVAFRFVARHEDVSQIIKSDKILHPELEDSYTIK
jgi:mannose-6-phosphate isomerase-like protein (cupin superfamily)